MTKAEVLQAFWSSFGLKAYEENYIPPTPSDVPDFPYITYQLHTDSFGEEVALSASLWYRSRSWAAINAKTEEISDAVSRGGVLLRCDDGAIWLKRGSPFAQSMGDPTDIMIKRKYLNLTAEFITE